MWGDKAGVGYEMGCVVATVSAGPVWLGADHLVHQGVLDKSLAAGFG